MNASDVYMRQEYERGRFGAAWDGVLRDRPDAAPTASEPIEPPDPITVESTWQEHADCDWSWIGPGQDDEHAVCVAHHVRFPLPEDGFTATSVDPFDAMPQTGRGVAW